MKRLKFKATKDKSGKIAYQIFNLRGDYLGCIYWYYKWKRYVCSLCSDIVIDYECNTEINAILRSLQ